MRAGLHQRGGIGVALGAGGLHFLQESYPKSLSSPVCIVISIQTLWCSVDNTVLEKTRQDSEDLRKKGEKLSGLRDVPLIGTFADSKSRELTENSELLSDIAQETQKHSDKLAEIRNKLMGI